MFKQLRKFSGQKLESMSYSSKSIVMQSTGGQCLVMSGDKLHVVKTSCSLIGAVITKVIITSEDDKQGVKIVTDKGNLIAVWDSLDAMY